MGVISLMSCSGAPGVTTVSLATTAALTATSAPEPVMIEVAVSGGVVASQYDLPSEPGLTSLAIALGGEPPDMLEHAQELPGGVPVVVAPASNSKIVKLVEARAEPLAHYLADAVATSVVDCGRISSASPLKPILKVSALVGLVIRPSRENFQLAATTLAELDETMGRPAPVGWVIVGSCPWSHDEIIERYGLPVLSAIADDRIGAEAVAGLRPLRRRSPLARSAQSFADDIAKHLRIATPAEPLGYLHNEPPPEEAFNGPPEVAAPTYPGGAGHPDEPAVAPESPDLSEHRSATAATDQAAVPQHPADLEDIDSAAVLPPLPGASVR